MADPIGFLNNTERELPARRPVPVRILDSKEVYERQELGIVERQAGRCMDCGVPFCHQACPLGNLIPEWNTLVWESDWRAASERLHATNNFPEFTGRLCPAPCEAGCVLAINQPAVTIKNVEQSIADQAFEQGWVRPQVPNHLTGKTVAVIGSGPAGLAAAQQLTRSGHTVVVYERADAIGGLLRYGIPEFKMEKSVLDRRLAQMEAEGTRFYTNVDIGSDYSGEDLMERFDAVVFAGGSIVARDLPIPGRDLGGVHLAVDYLTGAAKHDLDPGYEDCVLAEGKDVVIVGGGDTGADCLGTALRQGAKSVTLIDINPRPPKMRSDSDPWPTYPKVYRVSASHEEGGERVFSASTVAFEDGVGVGEVTHVRLCDVESDENGLRPVGGTDRVIPAQLVLLAIGFSGAEREGFVEQLGLQVEPNGRVRRDTNWQSTRRGVFVAGDAGRGQSLVVWAIAEGRSAAAAVDEYLRGQTELPTPISVDDRPFRP